MSAVPSSSPSAVGAEFTPEDLLRLPDAVGYELVDGKLVERNMGMRSSRVGLRVGFLVSQFLEANRVGIPFGADATYQCFPDAPRKVRSPDFSVIRFGRLPGDVVPAGHCPIPPDLAVEVISPNDLFYDVNAKVNEYLTAGTPLVWVIDPNTRTIRIHRPRSSPHGPAGELSADDQVSGEDVIPGFTCPIAEFFA